MLHATAVQASVRCVVCCGLKLAWAHTGKTNNNVWNADEPRLGAGVIAPVDSVGLSLGVKVRLTFAVCCLPLGDRYFPGDLSTGESRIIYFFKSIDGCVAVT